MYFLQFWSLEVQEHGTGTIVSDLVRALFLVSSYGREIATSPVSLYKDTNPFMKAVPSWPISSKRPHLWILTLWWLGFQHMNVVRTQNFHVYHEDNKCLLNSGYNPGSIIISKDKVYWIIWILALKENTILRRQAKKKKKKKQQQRKTNKIFFR